MKKVSTVAARPSHSAQISTAFNCFRISSFEVRRWRTARPCVLRVQPDDVFCKNVISQNRSLHAFVVPPFAKREECGTRQPTGPLMARPGGYLTDKAQNNSCLY